ncbi:venom acid phosphatase Acph-1 [Bacillus rossius redtenbacheri]|uniref:venom acid phosphatase Acph-1 n=1 Tax=Bacillus rossius redtenbacheri TaxID=93214 RepID=UPI002FDDF177
MAAQLAASVLLAAVLLGTAGAEDSLRMVHAVFRHGQRTPQDTYPNDPYVNYSFSPVGWGLMTTEGKRQQYEQGRFLRARYGSLLGDYYSPDIVAMQSTGVDRTQMSAQLEAAGMWRPVGWQRWNPDLDWQPVPVYSQPLSHDTLLLVRTSCPKYHLERARVLNSSEVQEYINSLNASELYAYLETETAMKFTDPDDVQSLYSTLKAEEEFKLTLPEWTRNVYPHRLYDLTVFSFILNSYNKELQRIKGGPLLKKILEDSKAKADGTLKPAGRKMFMYAGHDSTVTNLMQALGVWDPQLPVYNILALLELHEAPDGAGHAVKVYLRNTTEAEPHLLRIPGCDTLCPLDQFVELTRDVVPTDLAELCKVDDPNFVEPSAAPP